MSIPLIFGDPSIAASWVKGAIPTVVPGAIPDQKNRNQVYIVARSKVTASVVNGLTSPLVPSPPLSTSALATDQYIYFHLVYESLASNTDPSSITPIPGPNTLAFISQFILNASTVPSFTPVPFILNRSGAAVSGTNIQPFILSPVGISQPNLSYTVGTTPDTSSWDASVLPPTPIFLVPQGTDSISIYSDQGNGGISLPISSSAALAPNLDLNQAYVGVWYKGYLSAIEGINQTPGSSGLWHVINPFTNPPASATPSLYSAQITTSISDVQLASFTGGGSILPTYVTDSGTPADYTQSPTATAIFVANDGNPITPAVGTAMVGAINDVGNVLSNWGLSEMEIMFLPYQSDTFYSSPLAPPLGCYTTVPLSGIAEFQEFVSSAYNDVISYVDPFTNTPVYPTGCVNNTFNGFLVTTVSTSGGSTNFLFNDCMLINSAQCNDTTLPTTAVNGYWYQYCTGNDTCGVNNCYGHCPVSLLGQSVPCVRDYAFLPGNPNNTTFWSCNPIKPVPTPDNGGSGTSGNFSVSTANSWIISIIIVILVIFIIGSILVWLFGSPTTETMLVTTEPVYGPQPLGYSGYVPVEQSAETAVVISTGETV